MTDEQLLEEHDRHVKIIADAVLSLMARFGPKGLKPISCFQGGVRGAAMALGFYENDKPAAIAALLDAEAAVLRALPADAFRPTRQ